MAQKKLIARWPSEYCKTYVFDPEWSTQENYEDKYKRLRTFADKVIVKNDEEFIVIGASAGGPLAVRYVFDHARVDKAFLLVGKLKGSIRIGRDYRDRAPALLECVRASEAIIEKHSEELAPKTAILRQLFDGVVPLKDMVVDGARRKRFLLLGHTVTIVFALFFYFPSVLKEY